MVSWGPERPPAGQIFEKWCPFVDLDNFSWFLTSKYGFLGARGASGGSDFWKMAPPCRCWQLFLMFDSPNMGWRGQWPPAGQDFEKWRPFLILMILVSFWSHQVGNGGGSGLRRVRFLKNDTLPFFERFSTFLERFFHRFPDVFFWPEPSRKKTLKNSESVFF